MVVLYWGDFTPQGHPVMSASIFSCERGGEGCCWHLVGGARDVATHPTMHSNPPDGDVIGLKLPIVLTSRNPAVKEWAAS